MMPFWSPSGGGFHTTDMDSELTKLMDTFCGGLAGAKRQYSIN